MKKNIYIATGAILIISLLVISQLMANKQPDSLIKTNKAKKAKNIIVARQNNKHSGVPGMPRDYIVDNLDKAVSITEFKPKFPAKKYGNAMTIYADKGDKQYIWLEYRKDADDREGIDLSIEKNLTDDLKKSFWNFDDPNNPDRIKTLVVNGIKAIGGEHGYASSSFGDGKVFEPSVLTWYEGDIKYALYGNSPDITLDQLIEVAKSMK